MLSEVWLPVRVVGDNEPRQPGAVIIHNVAGAVSWPHDLQVGGNRDQSEAATLMGSG